jgi:hypothetical protein
MSKVPSLPYTNRKGRVYICPSPVGSPRFARGTAVPPAGRGNLKEGVETLGRRVALFFCEQCFGNWY